jgi:hypothetical protein
MITTILLKDNNIYKLSNNIDDKTDFYIAHDSVLYIFPVNFKSFTFQYRKAVIVIPYFQIENCDISALGFNGIGKWNDNLKQWDIYPDKTLAIDGNTLVYRDSDHAVKIADFDETNVVIDTNDFGTTIRGDFKTIMMTIFKKIRGLFSLVGGKVDKNGTDRLMTADEGTALSNTVSNLNTLTNNLLSLINNAIENKLAIEYLYATDLGVPTSDADATMFYNHSTLNIFSLTRSGNKITLNGYLFVKSTFTGNCNTACDIRIPVRYLPNKSKMAYLMFTPTLNKYTLPVKTQACTAFLYCPNDNVNGDAVPIWFRCPTIVAGEYVEVFFDTSWEI